MIVRLALRSLAVRPVRTAVLACGFGLGVAVMAALLGVGDVILEQARAPDLQGGGDMIVTGAVGSIGGVRFYLTFLVGPELPARPGFRAAGVRLQLDRDGRTTNYSARDEVEERKIVDLAPDLDIGGNQVRLDGQRYRIALTLKAESGG